MSESEQSMPHLKDSDIVFILIKRLEKVAAHMMDLDYENVEKELSEMSGMIEWLLGIIERRHNDES